MQVILLVPDCPTLFQPVRCGLPISSKQLSRLLPVGWEGWKRGIKQGGGFPPCIFAVPILAQSLRVFLFNGNDASLDLGCKLLPTLLLFFHIRSHLRGAAGPSSVFHQLMPAPRRLASLRGGTGSPSVREAALLGDCWEAGVLPGGCGGSLTGRGYPRNRLNNT